MISETNGARSQPDDSSVSVPNGAEKEGIVFRLATESIAALKRQAAVRLLLVFGAIAVVTVVFGDVRDASGWALAAFLVVMVGALATGAVMAARRVKEMFSTFTVIMSRDAVVRRSSFMREIRIGREEITSIRESRTGSIHIRSRLRYQQIIIPGRLEQHDDFLRLVGQWHKVETARGFGSFWYWPTAVLMLLISWGMLYAKDRHVVICSSAIMFIVTVWGLARLRSDPNADERLRRLSWVNMLLLIWSVARLWQVLSG